MTPVASPPEASGEGNDRTRRLVGRNAVWFLLVTIVVGVAAYSAGVRRQASPPGDASADAGFARGHVHAELVTGRRCRQPRLLPPRLLATGYPPEATGARGVR